MKERKRFELASAANEVWARAVEVTGVQHANLGIGFSRRADGVQLARLETVHGEPVTGYMLPAQLMRCMESMQLLLDHMGRECIELEVMRHA